MGSCTSHEEDEVSESPLKERVKNPNLQSRSAPKSKASSSGSGSTILASESQSTDEVAENGAETPTSSRSKSGPNIAICFGAKGNEYRSLEALEDIAEGEELLFDY